MQAVSGHAPGRAGEGEAGRVLTLVLFLRHDGVAQGEEAEELVRVGVPHLDGLQERGVPE